MSNDMIPVVVWVHPNEAKRVNSGGGFTDDLDARFHAACASALARKPGEVWRGYVNEGHSTINREYFHPSRPILVVPVEEP